MAARLTNPSGMGGGGEGENGYFFLATTGVRGCHCLLTCVSRGISTVLKLCRFTTTPSSFLKPHTILGTPMRKDWAHHFINLYLHPKNRSAVILSLATEEQINDTKINLLSLVPRPTSAFYFSAAVGLVYFLTCVTRRVEG